MRQCQSRVPDSDLLLKPGFADRFEIGVTKEQLAALTRVSHTLDELLNRSPNRHAPYVGASAFATKAGIHASAVMKEPRPTSMFCPRRLATSAVCSSRIRPENRISSPSLSGSACSLDKGDLRVGRLLDEVKQRESLGYAYEGADASLSFWPAGFLATCRIISRSSAFGSCRAPSHAVGDLVSVSEAVVKVNIDGETLISAAEGEGPVNAFDLALRKDLGKYQRFIEDLELVDFRVRIFHGGTDAVTRVLIEFRDGSGEIGRRSASPPILSTLHFRR